jgi:hypothetical protein
MLVQNYKVYYERSNRRRAFKEVKAKDKKQAYTEFVKAIPGRRVLNIIPVTTNPK